MTESGRNAYSATQRLRRRRPQRDHLSSSCGPVMTIISLLLARLKVTFCTDMMWTLSSCCLLLSSFFSFCSRFPGILWGRGREKREQEERKRVYLNVSNFANLANLDHVFSLHGCSLSKLSTLLMSWYRYAVPTLPLPSCRRRPERIK